MISGIGLANAAKNGTANFTKIRYIVNGTAYIESANTTYTDLLPLKYKVTKNCVISGKTGVLTKAELLDPEYTVIMSKEINVTLSAQADTFISFDINYELSL